MRPSNDVCGTDAAIMADARPATGELAYYETVHVHHEDGSVGPLSTPTAAQLDLHEKRFMPKGSKSGNVPVTQADRKAHREALNDVRKIYALELGRKPVPRARRRRMNAGAESLSPRESA